jgi:hypothetical protein
MKWNFLDVGSLLLLGYIDIMVWHLLMAYGWHNPNIVRYDWCKIYSPLIWLFWILDGNEMFVAFVANFQTYLHVSFVAITQNFGLAKHETMYMSFKDSTNFFQYMWFKFIHIIMFVQVMSFLAALLLLMLEENVFWWACDDWSFYFPLRCEEKLIS